MASRKPGCKSKKKKTVGASSMILSGDEHNRCREALANVGANVNMPDENGCTPLMFAVKKDHPKCVNKLIKSGADVNTTDIKQVSPLLVAADLGYPKFVDQLIKAGADVNHCNEDGYTALKYSASKGFIEVMNILLRSGSDVKLKDKNGEDALYHAAHLANYESIEVLLKAGADVNTKNTEGVTPLLAAVMEEYDYFDRSHESWDGRGHHDRVKSVEQLIKVGADVNAETKHRTTALTYAAWHGYAKCMKCLIEAGADVNEGTYFTGGTPLIFSSRRQPYECIDTLLEAGADVNAIDDNGSTALNLTKDYNYYRFYPQCVKKLLRAGIHVNRFDRSENKNALGMALRFKRFNPEGSDAEEYSDLLMTLYAAGETLEGTEEDKIPEELKFEDEKLQLKHICREAIRKHLLKLDLHSNLFHRILRLGLPSALNQYLLFDTTLDNDHNDDGDEDDDNDEIYYSEEYDQWFYY